VLAATGHFALSQWEIQTGQRKPDEPYNFFG
jgi:hypothetical protein